MARRIANSVLNASTMDILNVIRQNASYEYQSQVPVVVTANDIPKVGEVLYGTPALANQFINALVNRIALYRINSATFNNPYARLKKGYLEFGETVEEIFVGLVKALDFDPEKAQAREHKRYMPDVKSAFHVMNWRVMYPITIQDEDLRQAFLSVDGVREMIARIVEQVYTSAQYDEFLLFKWMIIKAVTHGKMYPVAVDVDSDIKNSATAFRGKSNVIQFMSPNYNEAGVRNNTPRERQIIFMDSQFNAQFDVEVLASAFNMSKADFIGSLMLIDEWTTFDDERFDIIRAYSDGLEPITSEELALMGDVLAVLVDENWFQIYDNQNKMTEQYTASGLYWNYFYHVWKTISNSPFSNALVFVKESGSNENGGGRVLTKGAMRATETEDAPESLTFTVDSMSTSADGTTVVNLVDAGESTVGFYNGNYKFIQNEGCTQLGIAVHPFGSLMWKIDSDDEEQDDQGGGSPKSRMADSDTIPVEVVLIPNGTHYTADCSVSDFYIGNTITLEPESDGGEVDNGGAEA